MIVSMKRRWPRNRACTQDGMTLAEYLVAVAISALVLAGLGGVMRLGMIARDQGRHFDATRTQAEEVLDRIAWAIETADPRKQDDLKAMTKEGEYTSGRWLDVSSASGKRTLRYDWYGKVINEVDEAGVPRALLQNVSQFSMRQVNSSDTGLVEVRMTVKSGQGEVSYTMLRRLGGAW